MPTRRRVILGAAGAFALPTIAESQGIIYQTLLGVGVPRKPQGFSFFDSGRDSHAAVTVLQDNVDAYGLPRSPTLNHLAGSSTNAFFAFYLNALAMPINTMPIAVTHDPQIGDIFRVEFWPAGTPIEWYDFSKSPPAKTTSSFPVVTMRVFLAGLIKGVYAFSNYITLLPRFAEFTRQLFVVMYNWDTSKTGLPPNLIPGVGNVAVMHSIQGSPGLVQETRYGSYYPTVSGVYRPNPAISVNWGATLDAPGVAGFQPAWSIGADPLQLTSNSAFHGVFGQLVGEFRVPADPPAAFSLLGGTSGNFIRPPANGVGIASPNDYPSLVPPISLVGGPGPGGIANNGGEFRVDTLVLDGSFGTPEGQSSPVVIPDTYPSDTADFFPP